MNDYSLSKIISYLYYLDYDTGDHYLYDKHIRKLINPDLYSFLDFINWAIYIITPIVFIFTKIGFLKAFLFLAGINLLNILLALLIVGYHNNIKYKNYNMESLLEEKEILKKSIEKVDYYNYNSYNRNLSSEEAKRYYYYYTTSLELCEKYIEELKLKEELAEKEEKNKKQTEEGKIIDKYIINFNNFIKYLNENIECIKYYDYDFEAKIKEIETNGQDILNLIKDNEESHVLLTKTFSIYIEEVKSVINDFNKMEKLRTDENIKKFIKVLESFNTYFINLNDKIYEFKEMNLDITMNTILKELDIDNINRKENNNENS